MKNTDEADPATEQHAKNSVKTGTSDFVIGLFTFFVFVLFMTVWMYFAT